MCRRGKRTEQIFRRDGDSDGGEAAIERIPARLPVEFVEHGKRVVWNLLESFYVYDTWVLLPAAVCTATLVARTLTSLSLVSAETVSTRFLRSLQGLPRLWTCGTCGRM